MAETFTRGPRELRRSPLDRLSADLDAASSPGLRLREVPFTTQIGIRADPSSPAFEAVAAATGVGLPRAVGETTGDASGTAVLWLGPDEFLLVAEPDRHDLLPALESALGSARGQVVDLSANRTILEVRGPAARAALDTGVPADLHPRAFGVGAAITATLSRVPVLVWRTEEEAFRVMPRASFAEYCARWLIDAAREHRG